MGGSHIRQHSFVMSCINLLENNCSLSHADVPNVDIFYYEISRKYCINPHQSYQKSH